MQMSVCIKIDMKQNIAHLIMALFISQRPDHGTVNIGLYQMNQYHFTPRLRFSPHFVMEAKTMNLTCTYGTKIPNVKYAV